MNIPKIFLFSLSLLASFSFAQTAEKVQRGKLIPFETILVHSKKASSFALEKIIKSNYNTVVIFTEKEFGVEPESPGAPVILPIFICDTCTNFSKMMDTIAHSLKGVTFIEVDRTQFPELFKEYKITKAPTLLAFKGGQLRIALNGAAPYESLLFDLILNLYDQGDYPPFCSYAE
jgi:thioredoxin-like negative regulator of GroEL